MKRLTRRSSLVLACTLLLGSSFGCKASDTAMPGYYDATGVDYAEREYAKDAYVADGANVGAGGGSFGGKLDEGYDEERPAEPPAPPVDMPSATLEPPKPEPSTSEPSTSEPSTARQIIYTASLQLAVYELDEAIELAEAIPDRFGGWIASRQDYAITLRVPAGRLAEVMDTLSSLGLVLAKTLQASDVTAEYTDLASRIVVLEQLHEQLLVLLEQAKTVEQSLKVRQELERVRLELESARARMRTLSEQIAFSTLTVYFVQRGADEALPSSNDPFPWVDQLGVESTEFR